jgi:hypothetical protein
MPAQNAAEEDGAQGCGEPKEPPIERDVTALPCRVQKSPVKGSAVPRVAF